MAKLSDMSRSELLAEAKRLNRKTTERVKRVEEHFGGQTPSTRGIRTAIGKADEHNRLFTTKELEKLNDATLRRVIKEERVFFETQTSSVSGEIKRRNAIINKILGDGASKSKVESIRRSIDNDTWNNTFKALDRLRETKAGLVNALGTSGMIDKLLSTMNKDIVGSTSKKDILSRFDQLSKGIELEDNLRRNNIEINANGEKVTLKADLYYNEGVFTAPVRSEGRYIIPPMKKVGNSWVIDANAKRENWFDVTNFVG